MSANRAKNVLQDLEAQKNNVTTNQSTVDSKRAEINLYRWRRRNFRALDVGLPAIMAAVALLGAAVQIYSLLDGHLDG